MTGNLATPTTFAPRSEVWKSPSGLGSAAKSAIATAAAFLEQLIDLRSDTQFRYPLVRLSIHLAPRYSRIPAKD